MIGEPRHVAGTDGRWDEQDADADAANPGAKAMTTAIHSR
jgi:hypothetical protein